MKIYQKTWFMILMLIGLPPVGIFLIWKYKKFSKTARIILTIIFTLTTLFNIWAFSIASESSNTPNTAAFSQAEHKTKESASSKNDNLLMTAKINEAPVMNGIKTEKIGTYAYVKLTYKEFKSLTPKNFAEFAKSKVKNSGYNWFSIITDKGEGVCWAGSYIDTADFGILDQDGCISKLKSTWELSGNTYLEIKDTTTERKTQQQTKPTTKATTESKTTKTTQRTTTTKKETATQKHLSIFIANTNTGKFHYSSCYMVDRMKESNKKEYNCTYDDMLSKGYSPCKKCMG